MTATSDGVPRSPEVPHAAVQHVMSVAGFTERETAASAAAMQLAELHDAQLTILYSLSPLSPLSVGTEAMAQREEFKQARSLLMGRLRVARKKGLRAQVEVQEGHRADSVAAELDAGTPADIIVIAAATSVSRWDWLAGRRLERLLDRVSEPVLAVHGGDSLDFQKAVRAGVLYESRASAADAALAVARLVSVSDAPPAISLLRIVPEGGDSETAAAVDPGIEVVRDGVLEGTPSEIAARLSAASIDLVVLAADAPRSSWFRRGLAGRLVPKLPKPVLILPPPAAC